MDGCMHGGVLYAVCTHGLHGVFFSVFWSGCMIPPQFLLGLHMMGLFVFFDVDAPLFREKPTK